MTKAIYFDMDGTIADLYNVDGWLDMLHAEDATPYEVAAPMYDMAELNNLLCEFVSLGYIIGVVSWTAMNGSAEYNKAVRKVKKQWIEKHLPVVEEFHVVKYGTPKRKPAKVKNAILVDDNEQVRNDWHGMTVDANKNIIEELKFLLDLVM